MAIETLVKTVFSDEFRKERWEDLNAGKLLDPQFKKDMKFGDEVDVQFHDPLKMSDYEGGDLDVDTAEKAGTSTVKVKINKGKSVFFKLDEAKLDQIKNAKTNDEKIKLIQEYSTDAREQFDRAINKACCEHRIRATMLENNRAMTISDTNVHQVFASAKTALVKGDGKGHTAWKDGEMIAVISPEMEAFMSTMKILQYSDVMAKHYKKGFVGMFMGIEMARDKIQLNYYKYDKTDRAGSVAVTPQTVTQANGITLEHAFAGKDNSVVLHVTNSSTSADSTVTIKAGEKQNSNLGDLIIPAPKSAEVAIVLNRDMASFEKLDGSVDIDFATGFTGTIYATAEKAGLGS